MRTNSSQPHSREYSTNLAVPNISVFAEYCKSRYELPEDVRNGDGNNSKRYREVKWTYMLTQMPDLERCILDNTGWKKRGIAER